MKPLINLTKNEVVEIGKTMTEIPIDLIVKAPADGLSGLTDEDKIGFSYDDLDKYIKGEPVDTNTLNKIQNKVKASEFKRLPVPAFVP